MAQFIQSEAMSPIAGNAGQFSPVQNTAPTLAEGLAQMTQTAGNIYETAADVYGTNRGQAIVEEEIENIDRARSIAESSQFTAGDPVPESINMDQKQWDLIATGVQNGTISREKARLLAASRLRTRIAEEPFFANRMRKAASGVLGFNIESEGARQYFASFQTEAQLAQAGDGLSAEVRNRRAAAAEESRLTGVPEDKILRQMWQVDAMQRRNEIAKIEIEQGLSTAQQAFSEYNRDQTKVFFNGILGSLKEVYDTEGSVKPEVYNQALADAKAVELENIADLWKGNQTDPSYARAIAVVEERYDAARTLMESVDYDQLNKILIDRNSNERTLYTDKHFTDVKIISETSGQEGVRAYFDFISKMTNETQRKQMLERYPMLKRYIELNGDDPDELSNRISTVARKLIGGEQLSEEELAIAAPVVSEIHENNTGNPDLQTNLFDQLVAEGMKYSMVSIVTNKSPRSTSVDNVKNVKRIFDEELEPMVFDLSRQVSQLNTAPRGKFDEIKGVNRFGEPSVRMEFDERGNIQLSSLRPLSLPQGKMEELRGMAARINQYNKAFDNGWGNSLNSSKEQYQLRVKQLVERGRNSYITSEVANNFNNAVINGAENSARTYYEELKKSSPDQYTKPFEVLYDEIRARRLAALEGREEQ